MLDPDEAPIEKWMLMQATEVYNYYSCAQSETNPRVKEIWTRFVDYELGQLHAAMELFQRIMGRDPAELLPESMPDPIEYASHRDFVRETLQKEVDLRARGTDFVDVSVEAPDSPSALYRDQMNSEGSPSELVASGYRWRPGTELSRDGHARAARTTEIGEESAR
jgi:hypothetical protein